MTKKTQQTHDFQGVRCPTNYVKTKLVLEELALGSVIEVIVDDGEPARHVPEAIKKDGQHILNQYHDENGLFHIVIEKTAEYE